MNDSRVTSNFFETLIHLHLLPPLWDFTIVKRTVYYSLILQQVSFFCLEKLSMRNDRILEGVLLGAHDHESTMLFQVISSYDLRSHLVNQY
jgi:hypothetical protein